MLKMNIEDVIGLLKSKINSSNASLQDIKYGSELRREYHKGSRDCALNVLDYINRKMKEDREQHYVSHFE